MLAIVCDDTSFTRETSVEVSTNLSLIVNDEYELSVTPPIMGRDVHAIMDTAPVGYAEFCQMLDSVE